MRIGVPTTSYPRFDGDVAGVFVRELCRALVRRGHRCHVIAPDDEDARPLPDEGIEVERVAHRPPGWPRTFYGAGATDNMQRDRRALVGALAYSARLTAAVRASSSDWDAVLSHWALPSAAATSLAQADRRHVAVWHSADVHLASRLLGRAAWPLLRGAASHHVFVAQHLRERLGARADARASVIPMGITTPEDAVRRVPLASRALRVLVLARLVPIKRVALAIEACARAGAVELVIAGDGPEREPLRALAERRGLDARFVGTADDDAKRALFAWADVFLATSGTTPTGATEGYPVAPREALAHGVVVIATDDAVHRELSARVGRGVLLAPEHGLAQILRALASEPARLHALSCAAREAVRGDDWAGVAERFERVLTGPDHSTCSESLGGLRAPPAAPLGARAARAATGRAAPDT